MSLLSAETFYFVFRIALALLSLALIYATAIPILRSDAWWIRLFDFPRLQIVCLIGVTAIGYVGVS